MPLFAFTILVSAFLLFQVQPLIARVILPWFGGTPGVWTTSMLFFQTLLLAGYAYAHLLTSRLTPRRQALVHGALVTVSALALVGEALIWDAPLLPGVAMRPPDSLNPTGRILVILLLSVGLPYFTLSTTGPLLQAWFARRHPDRSAYRLYALSNAGSLVALLSYPFAIEPAFTLRTQGALWAVLFAAFATGALALARGMARVPGTMTASPEPSAARPAEDRPGATSWALWIALSAAASVLLLAITNQLSQEVAVVPFLWIVPLVLYLLTFILCFESDRWYTRGRFLPLMGIATLLVAFALYRGAELNIIGQIVFYALMLFVGAMVCHGELARLRPSQQHLTAFYLAVSIGGALGGLAVGLGAPALFDAYWELHASIVFAWALVLVLLVRDRRSALYGRYFRLARFGVATGFMATLLLLATHARTPLDESIRLSRGFYGVLKVIENPDPEPANKAYGLMHGQIAHGWQFSTDARKHDPTTYYARQTAVGIVLKNHPKGPAGALDGPGMRIGVVGLGVGTLAAYGGPRDYLRFYEINPEVVRLAEGEDGYFSFLKDSPSKIDVVLGDARMSLEREARAGERQRFDAFVLDAFSSDSVPVHLLTREAFGLYLEHLAPDGMLLVHISNRYLDLAPIVMRIAGEFGLAGAQVFTNGVPGREEIEVAACDWIVLARDPKLLEIPGVAAAITSRPKPAQRLWTDDYSALLAALKPEALRKF